MIEKTRITAYVMCKNEEEVLSDCLNSLKWCDEIIVADTGSTDKTTKIATSLGAKVINVPFLGFGTTRNYIIKQIDSEWIVCFDADEVCTEELADEIKKCIKNTTAVALQANRRNFLCGREIKHSGWCPDFRHPVAFKKGYLEYTEKLVHEGFTVKGRLLRLRNSFLHYTYRNLNQLVQKRANYCQKAAQDILKTKKNTTYFIALRHAIWAFFKHYFLRKGFLDGWYGFIISFSTCFDTFFKYAIAADNTETGSSGSTGKTTSKIP